MEYISIASGACPGPEPAKEAQPGFDAAAAREYDAGRVLLVKAAGREGVGISESWEFFECELTLTKPRCLKGASPGIHSLVSWRRGSRCLLAQVVTCPMACLRWGFL